MQAAVALEVLEGVHSPELGNRRDVLVYIPPSYPRGDRSYPVLYMQDGQNLFDPGTSFAGEWGVGRSGDNPQYIQNMHDFLKWAGGSIAHEAYFNTGKYQLYPVGPNPKSSQRYRELF